MRHFSIVSLRSQLWMNYKPLTWYEQEYLRFKAHFEALSTARCSLHLFALKVE